jgi:hypothetical protein
MKTYPEVYLHLLTGVLSRIDSKDGGSKLLQDVCNKKATIYKLTWYHIPEDLNLRQCHCENLKCHLLHFILDLTLL